MKIESKFNIGDHVCGINYLHKLVKFKVERITVYIKADTVEIDYYPSDGKGSFIYEPFNEKYCFSSKDEAMAYINR